MVRKKRKKTTNAVEILDREFFATDEARAELEAARTSLAVSMHIHALRTAAGLTQRELAELVGTSHSVISRLESDDYDGYSLPTLQRVAAALGQRVEIRFLPIRKPRRA